MIVGRYTCFYLFLTISEGRGDPVLHIVLRDWADMMLIAPFSANTLALISNGICNNLLTSVVRAWDLKKSVIVCPAMNTAMWDHPFTQKQLDILIAPPFNYQVLGPLEQLLECGDIGMGAMTKPPQILATVQKRAPDQAKLIQFRSHAMLMEKKRQFIQKTNQPKPDPLVKLVQAQTGL